MANESTASQPRHNQPQSPLQMLPQEVLLNILNKVVFNKVLHVSYGSGLWGGHDPYSTKVFVCKADTFLPEKPTEPQPPTVTGPADLNYRALHNDCTNSQHREIFNTAIIQTCKWTYDTYEPLIFRTNMFSFLQGQMLGFFLAKLNENQKRNLHNCAINTVFCHDSEYYQYLLRRSYLPPSWGLAAATNSVTQSLHNLTTLQLNINIVPRLSNCTYEHTAKGVEHCVAALGGLSALPNLKRVQLVISADLSPLEGDNPSALSRMELWELEEVGWKYYDSDILRLGKEWAKQLFGKCEAEEEDASAEDAK